MILTTTRLNLREAANGDAKALAGYQSSGRYLEHYSEPPDAEHIIQSAQSWAGESPRLNYQLIVVLDGAVIGCAGLRQAGYPARVAELGVELDPEHWGQGYAAEALSALIDFGFMTLRLRRVVALTSAANGRAHRLLRSLRFVPDPQSGSQTWFAVRSDS